MIGLRELQVYVRGVLDFQAEIKRDVGILPDLLCIGTDAADLTRMGAGDLIFQHEGLGPCIKIADLKKRVGL